MTKATLKTNQPQTGDPVMVEVCRIKVELLEKFKYDLAVMARDARARQGHSGHPIITRGTVV